MRLPIAVRPLLLAVSLILAAACSSTPSGQGPGGAADPELEDNVAVFSQDRAWAHLEALAAIGPRAAGTPGAEKARKYISDELRALGLEVQRWSAKLAFEEADEGKGEEENAEEAGEESARETAEANAEESAGGDAEKPIELANLETTIPGASTDLIVLAAPYDSAYHTAYEYRGVNDGASGAALLLEVARVLVASPLPYTVRFLFLDAESPLGRGNEKDAGTRHIGSTAAANRMSVEGALARVRLLLLVNRVSDADLRIARDRFSHRTYRDVIWRTAAELGHEDVFAPASSFDAPLAGHRSFNAQGMRRTVALIDPYFGADELPDAGEHPEDDTLERSSPESLAVVGEVVLASLDAISAWLVKIDRFSESPVIPEPEPEPEPKPEPKAESGAEAEPEAEAAIEAEGAAEAAAESDSVSGSEPASDPTPESAPILESASEPPPDEAPAP